MSEIKLVVIVDLLVVCVLVSIDDKNIDGKDKFKHSLLLLLK